MNEFFNAVGLDGYKLNNLYEVIRQVEEYPDTQIEARDDSGNNEERKIELTRYFTENSGIKERGFVSNQGEFVRQEIFPFIESYRKALDDDIEIIELKNQPACLAKTDLPQIGCTLFSYIQNLYEISDGSIMNEETKILYEGISLTGLSNSGMVLLPRGENKDNKELDGIEARRRRIKNKIISGNDDAYEELTLTEMEIYSKIDKRVRNDGVYGIVQNTLMPKGIEEDLYFVIATIEDCREIQIGFSGQTVYQLDLNCCGINFLISINRSNLLGVPEEGRRFKGMVWMQSRILT